MQHVGFARDRSYIARRHTYRYLRLRECCAARSSCTQAEDAFLAPAVQTRFLSYIATGDLIDEVSRLEFVIAVLVVVSAYVFAVLS